MNNSKIESDAKVKSPKKKASEIADKEEEDDSGSSEGEEHLGENCRVNFSCLKSDTRNILFVDLYDLFDCWGAWSFVALVRSCTALFTSV